MRSKTNPPFQSSIMDSVMLVMAIASDNDRARSVIPAINHPLLKLSSSLSLQWLNSCADELMMLEGRLSSHDSTKGLGTGGGRGGGLRDVPVGI